MPTATTVSLPTGDLMIAIASQMFHGASFHLIINISLEKTERGYAIIHIK
jgi:hypothetical protein